MKLKFDNKAFGKRIRSLRNLKGWTQEQLGKISGLTANSIRSYEAGRAKPKLEGIMSLATTLSVPIDWLMTGKGDYKITFKDTKQKMLLDEMRAEINLERINSQVYWGSNLEALEILDSFISDNDLMNEFNLSMDEFLAVRESLLKRHISSKEEIIEFIEKNLRI